MPRKSAFKCYFGCLPYKGKLHHFPPPEYPYSEKFEQWKLVLSEIDKKKGDKYICNNIHICDHHFENFYKTSCGHLTKNAVPTLNIASTSTSSTALPSLDIQLTSCSVEKNKPVDNVEATSGEESTSGKNVRCEDIPAAVPLKHASVKKSNKFMKLDAQLKVKLLKLREKCRNLNQKGRQAVKILQKSTLSGSGPSRCDLESEDDSIEYNVSTPPRKKSKQMTFTRSTGVISVESGNIDEANIVNADIELIGLSPSSSIYDDTVEEDILELEQCFNVNPDSDIEEDGPDDLFVGGATHRRNMSEYNLDELSMDQIGALDELDRLDDRALRNLASEDMLHFNWSNDPATFTGVRETFTGQPGPTFFTVGMSPFQIFQQIWDGDIMDKIVQRTNDYGAKLSRDPKLSKFLNFRNWVPLTVAELWTFLSILMLQSIVAISVEKEYWYPCLPYLKIGNFAALMSYHRFKIIKRCLHFVDNSSQSIPSKLKKIQPVIDHLNHKFSSLYLPEQNIAIHESLSLWKGRLSFAQLIANKAAGVGIKSYELCESRTGYLWKMIIYAGKDEGMSREVTEQDQIEPEGTISKIVHNLVRPLLNKGHTLVMDNFYNSPLLSRTLKVQKTDTMGTLRLNREFVPDSLRSKNKSNMRPGEVAFSQTQDLTIVVWSETNVVSLISTFHKVEVGSKEKLGYFKYKPKVVLDYNLSMGGIDKKDQLLQAFPMERVRNQVWYKKLFRRLLNVSIHNTFIMFTNSPNVNMAQRQFRTLLADEILQKFRPPKIQAPPAVGHCPARNDKKKARCKWCAKKKIDTCTVWKCDTCNINLCLIGCFREYHTS